MATEAGAHSVAMCEPHISSQSGGGKQGMVKHKSYEPSVIAAAQTSGRSCGELGESHSGLRRPDELKWKCGDLI